MKKEWKDSVVEAVEGFFAKATDKDIAVLLDEVDYDFYKTVKAPVLDLVEEESFIIVTNDTFIRKSLNSFSGVAVQQWDYYKPSAADECVRYLMAA